MTDTPTDNEPKEQQAARNTSWWERDRAIIKGVQELYGLDFSGACRFIVRDWDRLNSQPKTPESK